MLALVEPVPMTGTRTPEQVQTPLVTVCDIKISQIAREGSETRAHEASRAGRWGRVRAGAAGENVLQLPVSDFSRRAICKNKTNRGAISAKAEAGVLGSLAGGRRVSKGRAHQSAKGAKAYRVGRAVGRCARSTGLDSRTGLASAGTASVGGLRNEAWSVAWCEEESERA